MTKKIHDENLPLSELKRRVEKAKGLLEQVVGLFPEARALAKGDRRRSIGRMGATEAGALRQVVDAMDARPAVFAVLADEDEGYDPDKLETDLIRDRFERHGLYSEMGSYLGKVAEVFDDTALAVGSLVKPVTLAAYEIAKPIAKRDPVIAENIAAARDYYGANAAAAAESRKARAGTQKE